MESAFPMHIVDGKAHHQRRKKCGQPGEGQAQTIEIKRQIYVIAAAFYPRAENNPIC